MDSNVTGAESLELYGYRALQESIDYKCEGEIKFEISINQTNEPIQLRDVNLQLCVSSWSNKWCTSPDSYFIQQPCDHKKMVGLITSPVCILDIQTMCRAISGNRNWYYNIYVAKVVGLANGKPYSTRQLALAPFRYQFRCKDNSMTLGMKIRGYAKQCQISNYIWKTYCFQELYYVITLLFTFEIDTFY